MRLLHLTDTHLGAAGWYRGAPPGWTRADDHLRMLRAALAPARRGEVDLVIHSGDLFDRSRPPPEAIAAARDQLAEVARQVPVVVIPGNHDRHGLEASVGGIPGVEVADRPRVHRVGALRLGLLPWVVEVEAWRSAAAALAREGFDLLVCHAGFVGTRVPGFTFRANHPAGTLSARDIPLGVRHVLNGHIHPRQVLRLGEAEIVMPGSTERTSFVERHDPKGVTRWELGAAPRWRFVDLPARPMRAVATEAEVALVAEGELVLLAKPLRNLEIETAVLARGGWVHPWREESPQVPLFGRGG